MKLRTVIYRNKELINFKSILHMTEPFFSNALLLTYDTVRY